MRNFGKSLLIALLLLLGISAFSQTAKRIVSLAPSLTKMVYLLEAGNELVGCTSYCEIPDKKSKAIVASAIEVSVEKVFVLKPDLVLASGLTKPSTLDALRKLGIKVEVFNTPTSFIGICEQLVSIGKLTGHEPLAWKVVTQQKLRLFDLKATIKTKTIKPKIFFQIGAKPLFTVTPNTFMDDYITLVGGTNIASDMKSGSITRENVLLKNPDVIIVITMGLVGEEEVEIWKSYKELSATKTNRIYLINSDKACSPTPLDFIDTVEQIVNMINK